MATSALPAASTQAAPLAQPRQVGAELCLSSMREREPGACVRDGEARANLIRRPQRWGEEPMAYLPYLRRWRLAARLTQEQLCSASHVALSTIRRIERRPLEHPSHLGLVHRLAEALGIANHTLIWHQPPEQLPASHALGHVYYLAEEGGMLRFRLPRLGFYMERAGEMTPRELSKRTGIPARDLEAMRCYRANASVAQVERIADALQVTCLQLVKW